MSEPIKHELVQGGLKVTLRGNYTLVDEAPAKDTLLVTISDSDGGGEDGEDEDAD